MDPDDDDDSEGMWDEAFSVLMQMVEEERSGEPEFARELIEIDEDTGYLYDIEGWLEDYLDELDVKEQYGELFQVCGKLIQMFHWEEGKLSYLKYLTSLALRGQGKYAEAYDYCEAWYQEEPDNLLAAASAVYARTGVKKLPEAEQIIKRYITEDTSCTQENQNIFYAARDFYQAGGDKKSEKKIQRAIKKFDKELAKSILGDDDDGFEEDDDWSF